MGLFGKIKKATQQPQPQPQSQPQPKQQQVQPGSMSIVPWEVPPTVSTYRMPAEHEATIYTYNGAPFKGLQANTRFVVSAVPADVEMCSMYTGTITSTFDFGDVAYSYNGQVFGMGKSHAEAVRNLMRAGYRVEVEAYIRGYNAEHGYPMVVGLFGFVDDSVYMEAMRINEGNRQ